VVDPSDRPVSGVVVALLDSTSSVVARALSGESGSFRLAGARGGTYRLRTMRIGYHPATSDAFSLQLGGEIEKRVALSAIQVSLDTVRVVDRNPCRQPSDQSATYSALEQVRTALSAAQSTLSGHSISATTVAYDRTLDADGKHVVKQQSRTSTAYVTQPWRAITPDSGHRAGFVLASDDGSITYFAPSIEILLSNVFIEDHCFKIVTDPKRPDLVGVAFEPSLERRSLPELKGTLWLNRTSAELQSLDYHYVNVSVEQEDAGAGGDISFAKLRNGGWVISRWQIRMPVLERVVRAKALGGNHVHLAEVQVAGGEIQLVTRLNGATIDTLWSRRGLTLVGIVVDSTRGTPIVNARVDLAGAQRSATTDEQGRFAIPDVLPGTYSVETRTAELDALGTAIQSTIALEDSTSSHRIRVPSAAQVIAALCGSRGLAMREALVTGRVYYRGDTVPAAGARVVAEWTDNLSRQEQAPVTPRTGRRLEGKTARDGTYRLCGVPAATVVTITAMSAAASSEPRSLFSGARVSRADLVVDPAISLSATFTGKVLVDSTATPIEGAEIYFPDLSKAGRSGATGDFTIDDITAGEQRVIVRRIGYGILDTKLTFTANTTLDRRVFLSRLTTLDSVVINDKISLNVLRNFEDNRRIGLGHFVDRTELATMTPDTHLGRIAAQWPGVQLAFGPGGRVWITGSRKPCNTRNGACYIPSRSESGLGVKIACYSQVYLDGVLMNRGNPIPPFEASTMFADQMEAIEWYAGPAETPGRYSDLNAVCGVAVIHTRRTP
jgi:hypothetical protein